MPATSIPVRGLNPGFVGQISHDGNPLRTPRQFNPTDTLSVPFGTAVVLNGNGTYSGVAQFIASGGTLTATTPLGIAVANTQINSYFPLAGGTVTLGGAYVPGAFGDALDLGSIFVQVNNGTVTAAGGTVYLRVAANGAIPAGVIGGFEAVADGANTVALTNVKFKNNFQGANGVAEVTILTRTFA